MTLMLLALSSSGLGLIGINTDAIAGIRFRVRF
jgi:hypothetical protein